MSRKAQALPMNTVIIAILVVLVLFVVAAFFLGGTSGVMSKIRSLFYGSIGGQDKLTAVQTCNLRCDAVKALPVSAIPTSAFCMQSFLIDENNNGEADYDPTSSTNQKKNYYRFYCNKQVSGLDKSLDVPCVLDNGDGPDTFCKPGYKAERDPRSGFT